MILEIQKGQDNPILRQKAKEIKEITAEIKQLALDMEETLIDKQGIGLAGPQIGKNLKIIRIDISSLCPDNNQTSQITLINPKIIKKSWKKTTMEEGCLSLPEIYLEIKRPEKITVEAITVENQPIKIQASGIFSKVLQHEIDHLDGILITDKAKK